MLLSKNLQDIVGCFFIVFMVVAFLVAYMSKQKGTYFIAGIWHPFPNCRPQESQLIEKVGDQEGAEKWLHFS